MKAESALTKISRDVEDLAAQTIGKASPISGWIDALYRHLICSHYGS